MYNIKSENFISANDCEHVSAVAARISNRKYLFDSY